MKKPGKWIVVASSLALAGCSSEVGELRDVIAPIICKVGDSDGRIYEATNIEPVNALNAASYQCTLAARRQRAANASVPASLTLRLQRILNDAGP